MGWLCSGPISSPPPCWPASLHSPTIALSSGKIYSDWARNFRRRDRHARDQARYSQPKCVTGRFKVAAGRSQMDIFDLNRTVIDDYVAFSRSFVTIAADDLRTAVDQAYADRRYTPEPLISMNPRYEHGATVDELASDGTLHPDSARIFRIGGTPLPLYRHQKEATALALAGESFVVTTGTGSGKSICFFLPIIDSIVRARLDGEKARTRRLGVQGRLRTGLPGQEARPLRPAPEAAATQRRRGTGSGLLAIRVLQLLRPAQPHRQAAAPRRQLRPPLQPPQAARRTRRQNPSRVSQLHQLRRPRPVSYVLNPDICLTGPVGRSLNPAARAARKRSENSTRMRPR